MLPIFKYLATVHKDVNDTRRQLVRVFECCEVTDGLRIKNDDVCKIVGCQQSAPIELQVSGGKPGHPVDGIFQREDLLLTPILAEQARKRTVGARMRL